MAHNGKNRYLWQKIAVEVNGRTTGEEILFALRADAKFLFVRCAQLKVRELEQLLRLCQGAIEEYGQECAPWSVPVGIICELSGATPRVQFSSTIIRLVYSGGQTLTLTDDACYADQSFSEVLFVTNFWELAKRLKVGTVLQISDVELTVTRIIPGYITCVALDDGHIKPFEAVRFDETCSGLCCVIGEHSEVECYTALSNGCRYIMTSCMGSCTLYHQLEEQLRIVAQETTSEKVYVFGGICPELKPKLRHKIIEHLDGIVVTSARHVQEALHQQKPVILKMPVFTDLEESLLSNVDVVVSSVYDVKKIISYLKDVNAAQGTTEIAELHSCDRQETAIAKCLVYASKNDDASAIVLLPSMITDTAEQLARMHPLRPVLVLTYSSRMVTYFLFRKYLFPILIELSAAKTVNQLIRTALIYGRRFGYFHPGNFVVSGFSDPPYANVPDALETRYVPTDLYQLQPDSEQ